MGKNLVSDVKPIGLVVKDNKPGGLMVDDVKPKAEVSPASKVEQDQIYSVTSAAGQSMGLLLTLTYPTEITVITSKSP